MSLPPDLCAFIRQTAGSFKLGVPRRRYMAQTLDTLGLSQRQAQRCFGWGRDTLRKALQERRTGLTCLDAFSRQLVLDLDNGPENSGRRSQWLFRLVLLAQRQQWRIVLVYYPPYHSKYNPIERLWGILASYWRGELLDSEAAVLGYAGNMTYNDVHPQVHRVTRKYANGVKRNKAAKKRLEQWLQRKPGLEKWALEINPPPPDQAIT